MGLGKPIKPIFFIAQPRNVRFLLDTFRKIDFIDKLFVKYHEEPEFYAFVNEYFREHKEYTHCIVAPDDLQMTVGGMVRLMRDIDENDFPVLSGVCNYCDVWQTPDLVCTMCRIQRAHRYVNICFKPIWIDSKTGYTHYPFLTLEEFEANKGLRKVAFQGFSPAVIRRDITEMVPFRPVSDKFLGCFDVSFSTDCLEKGVEQHADLNAFFRHWGLFHRDVLVGKEHPEEELVPAKRPVEDVL